MITYQLYSVSLECTQQLEKSSSDLNTLMASLKASDSALQRELDSIKDGTNDLATKFSKLRDRINQEIANKQVQLTMLLRSVCFVLFLGIQLNIRIVSVT